MTRWPHFSIRLDSTTKSNAATIVDDHQSKGCRPLAGFRRANEARHFGDQAANQSFSRENLRVEGKSSLYWLKIGRGLLRHSQPTQNFGVAVICPRSIPTPVRD